MCELLVGCLNEQAFGHGKWSSGNQEQQYLGKSLKTALCVLWRVFIVLFFLNIFPSNSRESCFVYWFSFLSSITMCKEWRLTGVQKKKKSAQIPTIFLFFVLLTWFFFFNLYSLQNKLHKYYVIAHICLGFGSAVTRN